jgi:hypothetical protein
VKTTTPFAIALLSTSALAQAPALTSWSLPKKPSNPAATAQAHVLLNADASRLVRVCYANGPDGSFIAARGSTKGGPAQATNVYKGACADIGGTDIELTNPNDAVVAGTYELQK